MGELVKYNNDMNNVSFAGFKEKELDLFFSLCFRAKDQGTDKIKIDFSELKKLSSYQSRSLKRFVADLDSTYNKILGLNMKKYIDEWTYIRFNLFTDYKLNSKEQFIVIRVHEEFTHILNNLFKNYTKFDLMDLVSLKSSYSKSMFRLLKQWEGMDSIIKKKTFSINELTYLLGIPNSYNVSKINEKVLKPIKKELPTFFQNFNVKSEKKDNITIGYTFTWTVDKVDNEVIEYAEDKKIPVVLNTATKLKIKELCKHNHYVRAVLYPQDNSEDNLIKLALAFKIGKNEKGDILINKEALIKGVEYACKKVKTGINIKYLKQTAQSGAEIKRTKYIIVEEEVPTEQPAPTVPTEDKVEVSKIPTRKKVTLSEFEELYKQFLTKENAKDTEQTKRFYKIGFDIVNDEEVQVKENIKEKNDTILAHTNIDITKKVYTVEDIPADKLLSKAGKKLGGSALENRVRKILKEMNGE